MNTFLHSVAFENIAKKKAIWKKVELCWNSQLVVLSTDTRITWIESWLEMSSWVLGNDETDVDGVQYFKSVSWFTRTRRKICSSGQALAEKLWLLTWVFFLARLVTPVLLVTISVFGIKRLKSFWFRKSVAKNPANSLQENKINFQRDACLCHGEPVQDFSGSANSWNTESAAKVDMLPLEPLLSP